VLPGGVLKSIVDQGDAKVFGWKGASVETEEARDVALDQHGSVEEEDLGFILVAVQPRSVREDLKDIRDGAGFSDSGATHQEGVVNKLVVRDRRGNAMQGKTC